MVKIVSRRQVKAQKSVLDRFNKSKFENGLFAVGVLRGERYEDGTRVADVAYWNEYGVRDDATGEDIIPARPAMRNALVTFAPFLRALGQRQAALIIAGRLELRDAVRNNATILRNEMINSIIEWDTPPNAPSTIAKKGFNDPLIETGLYSRSIRFRTFKQSES